MYNRPVHPFIYTCAPESEFEARDEFKRAESSVETIRRLAPGVLLAQCGLEWGDLAARLIARPPVWTRHANPVALRLPLRSDAGDLAALEAALPAVLMAKEAVNRAYETTLAEGVRFERRLFHASFSLADQKEGMAAFVEKRKPAFRNR